MSTTNQATRLQALRRESGMTLREVAAAIHELRNFTQIGKYEKDPSVKIAMDVLKELARVFKTTPEYIETGNKPKSTTPFHNMPPRILVTDNIGKERILMVPIAAQAGYRQHLSDEKYLGDLRAYSIPGFEQGTYRIFEVKGDSMLPKFKTGDLVICEHVESADDIKDGWPHVVVTTEGLCLKYVTNAAEKRGVLIIESENTAFKSDAIPVSEVLELWAYRKKLSE